MLIPTVSVIIPAYNAQFLGEAMQSVLDQTYPDFELVVVNDASPDNIEQVVKQFGDPRVEYIVHEENRGLPAARNTGYRATSGNIIALLDDDDIFHPDKLLLHIDFLESHPEIGASYNARFEMNHSANTIRELVRPPLRVSLSDFVSGYPFAPSDTVIRREWLIKAGFQDEKYGSAGDDLDLKARLALAGCKFAGVDRALNYRRQHSGKRRSDLVGWLEIVLQLWDTIFSDPRCPAEVIALRDVAVTTNYLVFGQYALSYGETTLGQEFIRQAVRLDPALLIGNPSAFVKFMASFHVKDESLNHETLLREIFEQLPDELARVMGQFDWAVGRGYLLRGARAIMWNRPEAGRAHFSKAHEKQAVIDDPFLKELAYQLYSYEREFGTEAAQLVLQDLSPHLRRLGGMRSVRRFKSLHSLNRAFHNYHSGQYNNVPGAVFQALANDPKHLSNRGVISMLLRSTIGKRASAELK